MKISVKGEYALQAVLDLASQAQGEPVKIADIARRQNIPQKFLELILASLKQGGFVESRRGAEGGYLLARSADLITIGQVVRFMEGSRSPQNSKKPRLHTPFSELWRDVEDAVSRILDQTSFSDLSRRWQEKQGKYIPNWDI